MKKSFSETGYIILRNAIKKSLVKNIQHEIYNFLKINENSQNKKYLKFCNLVNNLKKKEYDFTKPIFEILTPNLKLSSVWYNKPKSIAAEEAEAKSITCLIIFPPRPNENRFVNCLL